MSALGFHGRTTPLQVLTLSLHGETFALDALHVREILDPVPVTEVPGAPRFLNGLINVRGKVVPLLDLCMKLGMPPSPHSIDTRIIVVEVPVAGSPAVVGVRADRVYEMTELEAGALEDAPQIGMRVRSSFVRCIGKRAGDFLIVLDLEAILRMEADQPRHINRRQHKRRAVSLPCSIEMGGQTVQARVADLSDGGALISGFLSQPHGNQGRIEIEGLEEGLPFHVIDFQDGALRVKFEPGGTPSLVALLHRLDESVVAPSGASPVRYAPAGAATEHRAGAGVEEKLVHAA